MSTARLATRVGSLTGCPCAPLQSDDRLDALLTFSKSFELRDDVAVLEGLDLSTVASEEELRRRLSDTGDFAKLLLQRRPGLICGRAGK